MSTETIKPVRLPLCAVKRAMAKQNAPAVESLLVYAGFTVIPKTTVIVSKAELTEPESLAVNYLRSRGYRIETINKTTCAEGKKGKAFSANLSLRQPLKVKELDANGIEGKGNLHPRSPSNLRTPRIP